MDNDELSTMDIKELMEILPHRYPMLMVDKIIGIGTDNPVGIKNVTINEPFFQGHFPQKPVMPGVMIIEAMAQAAAAYVARTDNLETEGRIVLFMGVDKAKFRRPVQPGDQLILPINIIQKRPPVWRFESKATVDGKVVAEAQFSAMLSKPA